MSAFSHHVPDGGKRFILFASHIGVSESGEVGVLKRKGMKDESTSCGSLCGALSQINESVEPDPLDVEQGLVVGELQKAITDKSGLDLKTLTLQMAKVIHKTFHEIDDKSSPLALLGGVLINTPDESSDFFQPICFEVETETETVDLLNKIL